MASDLRPPTPTIPPAAEQAPRRSAASYDLEHAIRLMRVLPFDSDPELVVSVLRTTLDSLQVEVPELIDAATQRQRALDAQVRDEHRRIGGIKDLIRARYEEIAVLHAELQEIESVKKRLALVESVHRSLTTHVYTGFDL